MKYLVTGLLLLSATVAPLRATATERCAYSRLVHDEDARPAALVECRKPKSAHTFVVPVDCLRGRLWIGNDWKYPAARTQGSTWLACACLAAKSEQDLLAKVAELRRRAEKRRQEEEEQRRQEEEEQRRQDARARACAGLPKCTGQDLLVCGENGPIVLGCPYGCFAGACFPPKPKVVQFCFLKGSIWSCWASLVVCQDQCGANDPDATECNCVMRSQ